MRRERKTERAKERGQSCGGHILQCHIYYFTTAFGKEAALGLCLTHSTDDNHWGNSVNTGEWASNAQGEDCFFFFFLPVPIPCTPHGVCTRHASLLNGLWSETVEMILNILVSAHTYAQKYGVFTTQSVMPVK